jgi:hypothetical protein
MRTDVMKDGTGPAGVPQAPQARRPGRAARPARPARPPGPRRPASPVRSPGPGRPGRPVRPGPPRPVQHLTQPATAARRPGEARPSAGRGRTPGRTSFVLVLLGLLAGSLVCLLVVNTTLAANSIQISQLSQVNAVSTQRVEQLQQEIAAARSAAVVAREAWRLGMRPDPALTFVNLRAGATGTQRAAHRHGA